MDEELKKEIQNLKENQDKISNEIKEMKEELSKLGNHFSKLDETLTFLKSNIKKKIAWINDATQAIIDEEVISFLELKSTFRSLNNGDHAQKFDMICKDQGIYVINIPLRGNPKYYVHTTSEPVKKMLNNWKMMETKGAIVFNLCGINSEEAEVCKEFVKKHFPNVFLFDAFGIYRKKKFKYTHM